MRFHFGFAAVYEHQKGLEILKDLNMHKKLQNNFIFQRHQTSFGHRFE